jgi:hypothetical protein
VHIKGQGWWLCYAAWQQPLLPSMLGPLCCALHPPELKFGPRLMGDK